MPDDVSAWTKLGGDNGTEDSVWLQKASCEPTPQGRLVRPMYLWLFCHLFKSPLQQGGGTGPALPLALCPNLLSPINLTFPLKGAPGAISPPAAGRDQAPAGCLGRARESSGGGAHSEDLNKPGNRFRAGSGRSSWSRVNCGCLSLVFYTDLLCGLCMLLPPFHKDGLEEMYS